MLIKITRLIIKTNAGYAHIGFFMQILLLPIAKEKKRLSILIFAKFGNDFLTVVT